MFITLYTRRLKGFSISLCGKRVKMSIHMVNTAMKTKLLKSVKTFCLKIHRLRDDSEIFSYKFVQVFWNGMFEFLKQMQHRIM